MPKTSGSGSAKQEELPDTLKRSPAKAQRTFAKAHDAAAEEYGEGERAHRTAYAALKHSFEKVGDHWEPKEHKGPSDARSAQGGAAARNSSTPTAGGVDAHASKKHLYELAQRLDVPGRSSMTKDELVDALQKANAKATRDAR
jgi:cation transport regulator ChaB